MLPVFARDVLALGPTALGALLAADAVAHAIVRAVRAATSLPDLPAVADL